MPPNLRSLSGAHLFVSLQLACLAVASLFGTNVFADTQKQPEFAQLHVKSLLDRYCVRCHGANHSEADISVENIDPDIVHGEHFDQWEDIREAFNSGEMPPEDQRQPTTEERERLTQWMDDQFKKVKELGASKSRGGVRRLTRYELQYALEDLLHTSVKQDMNTLPEEGTSFHTGLKNSSRLLMISGPHLESYLNAIVSVIERLKEIVAFKPYSESLDIANLNSNPPQAFTLSRRKIKPPVLNIERDGKGVIINPKGYIDLPIKEISKYKFQTFVSAKADDPGQLLVSIGFTRSEYDPRQRVFQLEFIDVESSDEVTTYSLDFYPELLDEELTRGLDRTFFIRLSNKSEKAIHVESFDYKGNVNGDLTSTLVPADTASSDLENHIQQQLSKFIEKAFRRSVTNAEIQRYFGVYETHAEHETPVAALLSTYKKILCSPSFFYLGIPGELSGESKLNFKLAERLAFFLWCSIPDERLLKAASGGQLTTPGVLALQIDRMLKDKKSRRWVEHFTDQWLQTSKLFNVAVDKNYYPNFKELMKELMRQETIEAVNDVFRNGASAIDLLDAKHVFVNRDLSTYYRIKHRVEGDDFQKVPVEPSDHRGGLLTQATFMIGNSDGMNSHAILRGVWLSDVILNDPPPDPPKNVPPLDESIPGFDKMTLNEKLFAHRNNDACKGCHQKIDPWGIPFENYDASGGWRQKVLVVSKESVPTDVTETNKNSKRTVLNKSHVEIHRQAKLPGDVMVDGVNELKEYLVTQRKHDFAKGLTERILAYGLSRDIDFLDEDLVNHLVESFEKRQFSVPLLVREIVQSEQFRDPN